MHTGHTLGVPNAEKLKLALTSGENTHTHMHIHTHTHSYIHIQVVSKYDDDVIGIILICTNVCAKVL